MTPMTPVQAKLYAFLAERVEDPVGPSMDEMRIHMGLANKSTVHRVICELEARGLVTRIARKPRTIRVVLTDPLSKFSAAELKAELVRRGELIDGR